MFTNDIRFTKLPILIISIHLFWFLVELEDRYIFNERVKSKGLEVGINLNRKSSVASVLPVSPVIGQRVVCPYREIRYRRELRGNRGQSKVVGVPHLQTYPSRYA